MLPVNVETSEETKPRTSWLIEPSTKLMFDRGISSGHVLTTDTSQILLSNLTATSQYLVQGTCVGTIERIDSNTQAIPCNSIRLDEGVVDESSRNNDQTTVDFRNRINVNLTEHEKGKINEVLMSHAECFAKSSRDLGSCEVLEHQILTDNSKPIHENPYPSAYKQKEILRSQITEMPNDGVIEPSSSPWSSPVILVKKKDNTWRFCVDFRKLNSLTTKDVYPLPRIDEALSRLEGTKYFSMMDMQSGFWQIKMHPDSIDKTAFVTPDGLWQFKKMPFGLCNSPASFQRMMDIVLSGLKWNACLIYLDDVVIFGKTFGEHLKRLDLVLTAIKAAGLRLKISKCNFGETRLKMLGHIVDQDGIHSDPEKVEAARDFPRPKTVKDIQSFIGLCSYYRKFIPNFAEQARPLTILTKDKEPYNWNKEQEEGFNYLKESLVTCATLAHPDYSQPMIIHPDASGYGLGAILLQVIDGKEKPLGFASRLLKGSELNYNITEKECLAAVWALQKFRYIIWGCKTTIVTDHHALCWLLSKKELAGRLARWAAFVQGIELEIVHKSGKKHTDADALSRYPIEGGENEIDELDNNYIPLCTMEIANSENQGQGTCSIRLS